jgi:DHA1 family tetracycline resistance protein-like MFS transporter
VAQLLFAVGISFGSLIILFLSRVLAGIAGANFSIAQAVIADITPPEKRAQNFGIIGAAFGMGFILGPILGGYLSGITGDPATPFIFAGILGVINVLSISLLLPETHFVWSVAKKIKLSTAWHNIVLAYRDKEVRPLYAVSFLTMLGFGFFTAFTAVFLADRFSFPEKEIGIYFGIVGLWIVFAQVFVVRVLSNKYEGKKLLLWALPILAGAILVHPFMQSSYLLYLALPFIAISFGLFNANLPALISRTAPSDKQGATLGINGSLQALSQAIAPLAAGVFSGVLGLTTSFFVGGGLILAAFLVIRKIS